MHERKGSLRRCTAQRTQLAALHVKLAPQVETLHGVADERVLLLRQLARDQKGVLWRCTQARRLSAMPRALGVLP